MRLNIGRVIRPITTAIKERDQRAAEEREFKREYDMKLNEERRKADMENIPKIAKAEAERKLQLAKKGQAPQKKGTFEQLTGQKFFMHPGSQKKGSGKGKSRKASAPSNLFGGTVMGRGISDADMAIFGMGSEKKGKRQAR